MSDAAPTVGIYGGTFNPIHIAHLRAAEEVGERLGLERVVFVPSARPPHKRGRAGDADADDASGPIAPAALRLAWVQRAIADNPRFSVDAIEVERAGPSFLVDTLEAFRVRLAPRRPLFILGRDAFEELGSWREPERLLTLADFAVTTRPPQAPGRLAEWIPEGLRDAVRIAADGRSGVHREAGTRIELVEITALDVSATQLRAALREGHSVRYLIPESVREAIEHSGVYS